MSSTLREAAEQALEALERADKISGYSNNRKTIAALRAALAEPAQEPAAWLDKEINCAYMPEELDGGTGDGLGLVPLYTTAQQPVPKRTVTYVCPVCAASLERQE